VCNAHHLRELQCITKQYHQPWAKDMSELLLEIKATVAKALPHADSLSAQRLEAFERRYDDVIRAGFDVNPVPSAPER